MDYNAASCPASDGGFSAESLQSFPTGHDVLGRLVDASSKIPGLTSVSPENLEIIEHLGRGRDLIVSGPDRLATMTCAALPAIVGQGLVVVVTHSMNNIRRMKARLSSLQIETESFDLAPTKVEKRQIWEKMDRQEVQILIVTPGRLASQRFRQRLKRRSIGLIIIDQAQLMSPWSHKFLPPYRFIAPYLASLESHSGKPQKIAIVWNPNGRMAHDLGKLLAMNNPYQGRLIPESSPGYGIECIASPSDQDRKSILAQELDRSTGQGVIYCNSIKQLHDTGKLLEELGEDYASIRPGMDEFSVAAIRQKFEGGQLRIVTVIGTFLSESESTPGLDFVIFNGMPDSAETMARELFCIEESSFIRSVVICSDKDYFHHRFLIDKNYPDALVMRACVQGVRDVFGSKQAVTTDALITHVKMATPFPGEDVEQCLQVMFREGLLEKVVDHDTGHVYVTVSLTPEEEANFWHEYPLRKIDHIARLDRMRDFSSKDGDRTGHLQSIIRS